MSVTSYVMQSNGVWRSRKSLLTDSIVSYRRWNEMSSKECVIIFGGRLNITDNRNVNVSLFVRHMDKHDRVYIYTVHFLRISELH